MTISPSLDKRLDRVVRKHEKMRRNGVVHRVGSDGLIRTRARLIRPRFPMQGAMIIVLLFVAFKALLFAQMGSGNYNAKVEVLSAGTSFEQVGAFVMQDDPVTVALGTYLKQFFFQR